VGLFVLVSLIGASLCASNPPAANSLLYAIITEVINQGRDTAVYSITVNPSTGAIANVSENFFYAGGSATVDGVSGLLQKSGVYVYASDEADGFAHETNVYTGRLLPDIDIGAKAIWTFTADNANDRFILVAQDSQSGAFELIGLDGTTDYAYVFGQIPPTANLAFISTGSVNPNTSDFYMVASSKLNTSDAAYRVFTFSSSGVLQKTSGVIALPPTSFLVRMAYDFVNSKLYGVAEEWQGNVLRYGFVTADPVTGASKVLPISSITDGIVTSVTYSASQRSLFFCEARNGVGGVLHKINVDTGKDVTISVQGGWVLESLEASS